MSIGSMVRSALGERLARKAGRLYRSVFVDLAKVAAELSKAIPRGALVLDIGGGDGEPLNHLLDLRDDIRALTIDIAPVVGNWIDPRHDRRVVRLPRTSLDDYLGGGRPAPDAIVMCDVMHHIPVPGRPAFMDSLARLVAAADAPVLVVKDVEPGYPRARLGYWADRLITGDRLVSPVGRLELRGMIGRSLPGYRCEETGLFAADAPNYALVFQR